MADDLVNQLNRNLLMFEQAGMDEDAELVRARLAELEQAVPAEPEPEPEPESAVPSKATGKAKTATKEA